MESGPFLRLTVYTLLCCLYSNKVATQKEADHWYFSDNASIHFSNKKTEVLNDGRIGYSEPAASISDCRGNLLFYTDGNKVWRKDHQLMSNGDNLAGHYSSTQGALIVPWPQQCNLFFIFTLDGYENRFAGGLNYSVVDMTMQAGYGELILKNVSLFAPASEKMTAVHHKDQHAIWLITHGTRDNAFHVYKIDSTRIDSNAVISSVGKTFNTPLMSLGQMKVSPDGSKIAFATLYPVEIHLFDFDHASGIVTNPRLIDVSSLKASAVYGLEFSPDSKFLYVSKHDIDYLNLPGYLYQFDLRFTKVNDILNAATIVGTNKPPSDMRGLQLSNDGSIMVCKNLSNYFGILEQPNQAGAASNYVDEALATNKFLSHWTFTNFISSYFHPDFNSSIQAAFDISAENCIDEDLQLKNLTGNGDKFAWNFGNGDFLFTKDPEYRYNDTGIYELQLIAENKYCCFDTVRKIIRLKNCDESVFIPNAFTPNGDQINDYLELFSKTLQKYDLKIFDRWGNLVYRKEEISNGERQLLWDGQFENKPCLPGVYVYVLEMNFESGNKKIMRGDLNLVR